MDDDDVPFEFDYSDCSDGDCGEVFGASDNDDDNFDDDRGARGASKTWKGKSPAAVSSERREFSLRAPVCMDTADLMEAMKKDIERVRDPL